MKEEFVSINQASRISGVHIQTIKKRIKQKKIPYERIQGIAKNRAYLINVKFIPDLKTKHVEKK